MPSETVASAIRTLLTDRGMTQKQLALEAGYSPQFIGDVMGGRRVPPPATIAKIAVALGAERSVAHLCLLWLCHQVGDELAEAIAHAATVARRSREQGCADAEREG